MSVLGDSVPKLESENRGTLIKVLYGFSFHGSQYGRFNHSVTIVASENGIRFLGQQFNEEQSQARFDTLMERTREARALKENQGLALTAEDFAEIGQIGFTSYAFQLMDTYANDDDLERVTAWEAKIANQSRYVELPTSREVFFKNETYFRRSMPNELYLPPVEGLNENALFQVLSDHPELTKLFNGRAVDVLMPGVVELFWAILGTVDPGGPYAWLLEDKDLPNSLSVSSK